MADTADKPDDLSALMRSIDKKLGGAVKIISIDEAENPYSLRRPFGILSVDRKLKGGLPAGTMCQIFGPDGIGKDMLINYLMAENQRRYGVKSNIFWMSFGYKPDLGFMRMCGMQLGLQDSELIAMGQIPEDCDEELRGITKGNVRFIEITSEAADKPAESLLSAVLELIRSNMFQIGIINELGSGETKDNVKKSLAEDAKMATFASLYADFCRKFYTALRMPTADGRPNETTLVAINPVRANLNTMTAKFQKYEQPSGMALRHAKVIDIHLDKGGSVRQSNKKIGKTVKWKVAKGKHGISEGAEGTYDIIFNKGVDLVADAAMTAKAVGTIRNVGRYYYILDFEDPVEGGIAGVTDLLREKPKLLEVVKKATIERITCETNE